MKKIVIEIAPDGSTKIDSEGFIGKQCTLATRELELALAGDGPVEDRKKPEFFQSIVSPQAHTGS